MVAPSRAHKEGRIAIVTDVGCGMRWTRVWRETSAARGRPSRVVLAPRRWRQAFRRWSGKRRGLSSPAPRGEHGAAVNTIAQGMPVDPAKPVVTAACFFCCRRAMGEAITRHSLRPPYLRGTTADAW